MKPRHEQISRRFISAFPIRFAQRGCTLHVGGIGKAPWPKTLPEQIAAVRAALSDLGTATPEQVARHFHRGRAASVQPLLASLAALGQARIVEGGRFAM